MQKETMFVDMVSSLLDVIGDLKNDEITKKREK